uniref:Ankyrin repeat domain 2 n=1 Tax=Apteryx owenii TaxID=8824 RepID=A0A8B9PCI3_APTOW
MDTPELEEEKHRGPRNWGVEAIKVWGWAWGKGKRGAVVGGCGRWGAAWPPVPCTTPGGTVHGMYRRPRVSVPGSLGSRVACPPQGQERVRRSSPDVGPPTLPPVRCRAPALSLSCPQEGPVEPETFLRAAVQGKIRVVEKFLADGGSPDTCDEFHRTALHRCSLEGHMDILQKLLDSGATVDFRDRLDCTAVHWACRGGHLAAVKLLQDRGADLNLKDKLLSTPLHVATRTGHPDIVEHLIHCGAHINSLDREGDTALHDATRLSRYKIIKMLILHGADMMAKNLDGKTPTDLVQQWQVDTRQALETKAQPQGETEVPA